MARLKWDIIVERLRYLGLEGAIDPSEVMRVLSEYAAKSGIQALNPYTMYVDAAIIFIARLKKIPRPDIRKLEPGVWRLHLRIARALGYRTPLTGPEDYAHMIKDALGLDSQFLERFNALLKRIRESTMIAEGRDPRGLAAAIAYYVLNNEMGRNVDMRSMASILDITEETIRKRLREITRMIKRENLQRYRAVLGRSSIGELLELEEEAHMQ